MSVKTCLLVIPLLCLFIFSCQAPPGTVKVVRVIDGDTITVEGNYRVRYIGIDTPETYPRAEAFGIEALEANQRLVAGRRVRLERDVSDTDRYDRLLRYVYVDDVFVNAELVKMGLARAVAYPPDTRYQDYLEEMEAEARRAGRGIWAR